MHALILLVLAGAPVDVFAFHRTSSEAAQTLKLLDADATLVDASSFHEYLVEPGGMLGFQDFAAFSALAPRGWPAALEEDWKKGIAHCHSLVGPPPWKDVGGAMACGKRLGEFLWQRYLAQQHARRVYVLRQTRGKETTSVSGESYALGVPRATSFSEEAPTANEDDTIRNVLRALVAERGTWVPRELIAEFVTAVKPGVDLFAGQPVVSAAVANLKACPGLPSALMVSPPGVLPQSLAARWQASVKGEGAPRECTLELSQNDEVNEIIGRVTIASAVVRCGNATASAQIAMSVAVKAPVEGLSARLVSELAKRLCPER